MTLDAICAAFLLLFLYLIFFDGDKPQNHGKKRN